MDGRFWSRTALGFLVVLVIAAVAVVAYNAGVAHGVSPEVRAAGGHWRGDGPPFGAGWFFFPLFPLLFAALFFFLLFGLARAAWFGGAARWSREPLEDWHRRAHEGTSGRGSAPGTDEEPPADRPGESRRS
jgi:hypothetical protein